MAATIPFKKIKLSEEDIPGAKLSNPDVSANSVVQLKRFLVTHGVRVTHSMRKEELVNLANQVNQENRPVNPAVDNGKWLEAKAAGVRAHSLNQGHRKGQFDLAPLTGWKKFLSTNIPQCFCYGSIYKHIISTASIDDGQEDSFTTTSFATAKPLRKGRQFFIDGHVKRMEDATSLQGHFCVRAKVQASMRKEEYSVFVMLEKISGEVLDADCHCKASSMIRCSHITALLLAVEDYTIHFGYAPPPSTSQTCEWNKGRQVKSSAPVFSRQYTNKRNPSRVMEHKAVGCSLHTTKEGNLLKYSSQHTLANQSLSMWDMLINFQYEDYRISSDRAMVLRVLREQLRSSLIFNLVEPNCIPGTEAQASSDKWCRLRSLMITASSCTKFLVRDLKELPKKIDELLWKVKEDFDNVYITFGRNNEGNARQAYVEMTNNTVSTTGLWVNPEYPGLGASPDGVVICRQTGEKGLLEVKCSYVLRDHKPTDVDKLSTAQQSRFYLNKIGDSIRLNRNHNYFKQVQMQLNITKFIWCDFVVWTPNGLFVERVFREDEWWRDASLTLLNIHSAYICPEYFEMRIPRRLPLIQV